MAACTSCGEQLTENAAFCANCGAAAQQVPPPAPAQAAPAPEPVSRRKFLTISSVLGASATLLSLLFRLTRAKPSEAEGELIADIPITPEGANISIPGLDKGQIQVPPGAVGKPERITIRRSVSRRATTMRPPGGQPQSFPAGAIILFTFGPIGLVFNAPITIILPLPNPGRTGRVFIFLNGRTIFINSQTDAAAGVVRIQTTNLRFTDARQQIG